MPMNGVEQLLVEQAGAKAERSNLTMKRELMKLYQERLNESNLSHEERLEIMRLIKEL